MAAVRQQLKIKIVISQTIFGIPNNTRSIKDAAELLYMINISAELTDSDKSYCP